jgi:hypothetical protein
MDTKYYVAVRPLTSGQHGVHKEGCPFISGDEKVVYLGKFNSGKDAEEAGSVYFEKAKCCAFCSKEIIDKENDGVFILTDFVPEFQYAFMCCSN